MEREKPLAFTPKPHRNVNHSETPIVTANAYQEENPHGTDTREFTLLDGTPYARKVQAQCFTPSKTLTHSPVIARNPPTTDLQEVRTVDAIELGYVRVHAYYIHHIIYTHIRLNCENCV